MATDDGSINVGGRTSSFSWSYYGGTEFGLNDVIALRLDIDSTQLWRWQVRRATMELHNHENNLYDPERLNSGYLYRFVARTN